MLVVFGVLVAGAIAVYAAKAPAPDARHQETLVAPGAGVVGIAKDSTDPFDVTISFSDSGFAPTEIPIKKGQRVRFLNESTEGVWPASAIHPTHTLYPEKNSTNCLGSSFDACRALTPGEFFDFTFNYAGEWRYHDHVRAYNTGVITVTE